MRKLLSCTVILLFAGCSKKTEIEPAATTASSGASVGLVGDAERSRHFEEVNKHLELGGTLYGYADVDGDAMGLVNPLEAVLKGVAENQPSFSMFAKQDLKALFTSLGMDDVKAIGVSSVLQADGLYRNRSFLYTPQGRHGLFAVFGGAPGPFINARMAPADTDFYCEFDFDLKAIYDTTEAVIAKVNGPEAASDFRAKVKKVGMDSAFSLLDLIEGLKGRATIIIRFEPTATFTLPKPMDLTVPMYSGLFRVEGIGPAMEGLFKANSKFEATTNGGMRIYIPKGEPSALGMNPMFGFDGTSFYIFTSEGFAAECVSRKEGLDKNPAFVAALAALGPNGNGISWVTPRLMSRTKELGTLNETAPKQIHKFLESYSSNLPTITQPLVSVRTNLPDGILMRSMWNRSLKADLALVAVYNPVTVGVLAAMAIPAFQKVRQNSQLIGAMNNLKALSVAADAFFASHPGAISCRYDDLVGPDKQIKVLTPVGGEDYSQLIIYKGQALKVTMPDGRVIPYYPNGRARRSPNSSYLNEPIAPPGGPYNRTPEMHPDAAAIESNLRSLSMAADAYYSETGKTSTTFEKLVGPGKAIQAMSSIAGENYHDLLFVQGRPLRVYLKDGRSFVYPAQMQ